MTRLLSLTYDCGSMQPSTVEQPTLEFAQTKTLLISLPQVLTARHPGLKCCPLTHLEACPQRRAESAECHALQTVSNLKSLNQARQRPATQRANDPKKAKTSGLRLHERKHKIQYPSPFNAP